VCAEPYPVIFAGPAVNQTLLARSATGEQYAFHQVFHATLRAETPADAPDLIVTAGARGRKPTAHISNEDSRSCKSDPCKLASRMCAHCNECHAESRKGDKQQPDGRPVPLESRLEPIFEASLLRVCLICHAIHWRNQLQLMVLAIKYIDGEKVQQAV